MSASSKKKLRKEQVAAGLTERQQTEKKEAKKLKTYTIVFVTAMVLVVAIALGTVIGKAITTSGAAERNTVALTVNDHSISNAELSYYYIDAINTKYNEWKKTYGDYTAMYLQMLAGLDLSKPLSTQINDEETGRSWADYFVEAAEDNARSIYALCDAAASESFVLSEEDKTGVENTMANLRLYATAVYGYKDLTAYLKASYGYGASEESFRTYLEHSALALAYQTAQAESLSYDADAIAAYSGEHPGEYSAYSYASYLVKAADFLEGGTVGEDGKMTFTDEEKAASVQAAKEGADSLMGIESVGLLDLAIRRLNTTIDNSEAKATRSENILYKSVNPAFQEWLRDPSRVEGDMTIIPNEDTYTDEDGKEVTTTYGYYVVFFQSVNDNTMNLVNVRHLLVGFEGGTADANGTKTYSDEEKASAKAKAEELLAQWQSGEATEDSFAALATENSTDGGSQENGGLYENVYPGQMVDAFNDWCFDESRQPGDTGIVETNYGYHVMYYVGEAEQTYRDYMITNQLRTDDMTAWYDSLVEAAAVTNGDNSKLNRDIVLNTGK